MNPEDTLKTLRAAVDRLDAVCADPGRWGGELAKVLAAFESLDRWLSRGEALPAAWSTCHHPAVRSQRAARPAERGTGGGSVPGPRAPQ